MNRREDSSEVGVVALAGNPNVGKSTLFNALTGLRQHTGNWPGKTVGVASGVFTGEEGNYRLIDLPGTYSLLSHSPEEEIARDFLLFSDPSAVVIVCDATSLERNLNLVLQVIELSPRAMLCLNLADEAKKKGITVDTAHLSEKLGIPVLQTVARKKKSTKKFIDWIDSCAGEEKRETVPFSYPDSLEKEILFLQKSFSDRGETPLLSRWLAVRLLEGDEALCRKIRENKKELFDEETEKNILEAKTRSGKGTGDLIAETLVKKSEEIAKECVSYEKKEYDRFDRKLDTVLTSKKFGIPIMIFLLAVIFYITVSGANLPSRLLSQFFAWLEGILSSALLYLHTPLWLHDPIVYGVFRTVGWIVAVMLPPMAIFFPLFTLLEDVGLLPRIAFNLDRPFSCCGACGKQALTTCMGFGCNAVGVTGCRIIDSPRERLIAVLTNSFVPCNGRFPAMITLITLFFLGGTSGVFSSVAAALILTFLIVLGVLMTFLISKFLSKTILKGEKSSFLLELPPYRAPQIGKVIVRSIFDRTLFVLMRALTVAAPAGLVIFLFSSVTVGTTSILGHIASFLDPFASLFGMDGVLLFSFVLAFPANEIVLPVVLMAYTATAGLTDFSDPSAILEILSANGWDWMRAVSFLLFSLFHWPCSTTLLTIKKETGSAKLTFLSALLPTAVGLILCFIFTQIARLFI